MFILSCPSLDLNLLKTWFYALLRLLGLPSSRRYLTLSLLVLTRWWRFVLSEAFYSGAFYYCPICFGCSSEL